MNKFIRKWLRLAAGVAAFTLLAAGFTSCITDLGLDVCPTTDDETLVTFELQVPGTKTPSTRALSQEQENAVTEIDVLVFDTDGGNFVYRTAASGDEISGSSNIKTFSVMLRQGEFDIVLMAGARTMLANAEPSTSMTKAEALAHFVTEFPDDGKWPSSTPFPMWGDVGNITINASTDLTGEGDRVQLFRMVARVDVIIDEQVNNFELNSVRLYNRIDLGSLVPAADRWNDDESGNPPQPHADMPTIPEQAACVEGPVVYEAAGNDFSSEIYLFESENYTDESHTTPKLLGERTCIVVGGFYDSSQTETFYRVDFSEGSGADQNFLDVLRNHQYVFNITQVTAAGYDTPEEAFNSPPVNIEAGVVRWNEAGLGEIVFNGQNVLAVNKAIFELEADDYNTASVDNKLYIRTDYPGGWRIESITDEATGAPVQWVTVSKSASTDNETISLLVPANDYGAQRTAKISIRAGRMTLDVILVQRAVYSGGEADLLYFAAGGVLAIDTWDDMDETARANIAFFKFGSVVGFTNAFSDQYSNELIKFNPTSNTYTDWNTIPMYDSQDYTDGKTNISETGAQGYHTGMNVLAGKGDPCRLVGLSDALLREMTPTQIDNYNSGWRMPIVTDNVDFLNAPTAYYIGGSATDAIMYNADYPFWGVGPIGEVEGGWFPIVGSREESTGRGPLNDVRDGFVPSRGWRNDTGATDYFTTSFYFPSSEAYDAGAEGITHYGTLGADSPEVRLWPVENTVPNTFGTMRRCVKADPFGVTVHPPILRHISNTIADDLIAPNDTKINVHGGTVTFTVSTNLNGWGVKVYEGLNGTLLLTVPANPSQAIAPSSSAIESTVEVTIPENATNATERTLRFVLYCTEYPGRGNEVTVGTWTQRKYYTLTVTPSNYGTVTLAPQAASPLGYEYGDNVTLTAATTATDRFFNGWTVTAGDITASDFDRANRNMAATVVDDAVIEARFDLFADYGVQIGNVIWANYNIGMPHQFAASHRPADVMLYQYYHPGRDTITTGNARNYVNAAWPSNSNRTINASNHGINIKTGADVITAQPTSWGTYAWPAYYDVNPCPEGWTVPTDAQWANLRTNTTLNTSGQDGDGNGRSGTVDETTGYWFTSSADPNAKVFMPKVPRFDANHSTYSPAHDEYRSASDRFTNANAQNGWDVRFNRQGGTMFTAAYAAIRCVRAVQ